MILTKLTFIFMQKGTTFINTCCFSFDLELTLLKILAIIAMILGMIIVIIAMILTMITVMNASKPDIFL